MENEDCVFKSQEGSAKRNKPDNIDLKQFFSKDQKKLYQTVMYKVYEELGLFLQNWDTYTQYPIIRNGDQRPLVEFLKIFQISDSHRFLF